MRQLYDNFKLIKRDDVIKDIINLSDAVRDENNSDIKRIEKYCYKSAWLAILEILERKRKWKWYCNSYPKTITKEDEIMHMKDILHGCICVAKKHSKKRIGLTE